MSPALAGKDLLPNRDDEWEVEAIVDSRIQDSRLQYLIKWKPTDQMWDDTWEPAHFVRNARVKIRKFHADNPGKPKSMQSVRRRRG